MRSKKRSAASSKSKPPNPPPLFLDRSLGRHVVATALRAAGAEVYVHDDLFPSDAKDEVWLAAAGAQKWAVVTKDSRIRYRDTERAALIQAKVRAFVITKANLQGPEMAAMLVKALPAMARLAASREPPFIARVSGRGKVTILA